MKRIFRHEQISFSFRTLKSFFRINHNLKGLLSNYGTAVTDGATVAVSVDGDVAVAGAVLVGVGVTVDVSVGIPVGVTILGGR